MNTQHDRDADHRSRAGRACHRLPPQASRPRTADHRRERAGRRQLAAAVGHVAPVHAGEVRPAAGPAVPRGQLALPAEGRGRRLSGAIRAALRPSGADQHSGGPPRGATRRRIPRDSRRGARSAATTWWLPPAPSAVRPTCPSSRPTSTPSIQQLHSSQYRRPAQLRPGPVLVVGASHSGLDIAYELAESRPTILCGPDRGNIPFRPESRRAHVLMPVVVFAFKHVLTRRTPMGRKEMHDVRFHGGPAFRIKRDDLDRRGVIRNEARMTGVIDGRAQLADGTVLDVDQRGVVHRLQAGLRLDPPADPG